MEPGRTGLPIQGAVDASATALATKRAYAGRSTPSGIRATKTRLTAFQNLPGGRTERDVRYRRSSPVRRPAANSAAFRITRRSTALVVRPDQPAAPPFHPARPHTR